MTYYLVISTILFFAGIYGFITRRNLLAMLISIELILNSTDINFAVFNRFLYPEHMEGLFFALFSIAISAAETAIAIAIIINIYRNLKHIEAQKLNTLSDLKPELATGAGLPAVTRPAESAGDGHEADGHPDETSGH